MICPDHPHTLGARLNDCRECDREAAAAKDQRQAHAAKVKAAIPRRTTRHEPTPTLAELSDQQEEQP